MTAAHYHPRYRVQFSSILPENKILMIDDVIHVPESMTYKFIFMNDRVDNTTVKMAIDHAVQKLNRFIDRLS